MFCGRCMTEYLVDLKNCTRCKNPLVTMEERREKLLGKVEEFKEQKARRQERKKKWEMWKKTQAIYWKKTSTDYQKWEFFTDSEDEFDRLEKEAEPVVPEDDPRFQGLKKDMDERAARIKEKRKKTLEIKDKANKFMKKKNYLEAIRLYTEAIKLTKSYKYLWTNRALAHIKRGDWQEAVNDCTRILEFSEVLEDGYTKSRDANFKAFARRSMAYKGMKEWDKAIEDVDQCLKLFPNEESASLMKEEILSLKEKYEQLEEMMVEETDDNDNVDKSDLDLGSLNQEQNEIKTEIEEFVKFLEIPKINDEEKIKMKSYNYNIIRKIRAPENQKLRLYFYKLKGLQTVKRVFKTKAYELKFEAEKTQYYDFVHSIIKGSDMFIEETIKLNYPRILIKRINNYLKLLYPQPEEEDAQNDKEREFEEDSAELSAKEKQTLFIEMEEITNILICFTENRNARLYFREKAHLLTPIFTIFYQNLIQQYKTEHYLISNILNFYSNLLVTEVGISQNEIKDFLISNFLPYFFSSIGLMLKEKSLKFLNLKKSCLSFLSNLMIYQKVRSHTTNLLQNYKEYIDNSSNQPENDDKTAQTPKMEKNGVIFFFENLFIDSIRVLEKIVVTHGKFGENSLKYYDNMFGLILNMVYKLNPTILDRIAESMNRLKLVNLVLQVIKNLEIMKDSVDAETWTILMKRGVNIVSKFYRGNIAKPTVLEILENLLRYYTVGNDNQIINAETNKFLVVLLQKNGDPEFVHEVLELMNTVNDGDVFKVIVEMVNKGSQNSIVL